MNGTHAVQLLEGKSGLLFVKVISHIYPDVCVVEKLENTKKAVKKLRELERAMA